MIIKIAMMIVCFGVIYNASAEMFKSETVISNEVYKTVAIDGDFRGCVEAANAGYSIASAQMHDKEKMQLARYTVYGYLRARAVRAPRVCNIDGGVKMVAEAIGWTDFPRNLAVDVTFMGFLCSEYDVKILPFVVSNVKSKRILEEVVFKFYHGGEFVFALYVNLNLVNVSFDFIDGSGCAMMLTRMNRFPFLNIKEALCQWDIVKQQLEESKRRDDSQREKFSDVMQINVDI